MNQRSVVREAREALGRTQARVAAEVGISRQGYLAIETGAAVPSTPVALRIARALGSTVEALFPLPPEEDVVVEAHAALGWTGEGAVRLARVGGRMQAFPLIAAERAAVLADGLARRADGRVEVSPLTPSPKPVDLVVIGCDPSFGLVAEALRNAHGVETLVLGAGSRAALEALARGEAHVAGIHLESTGSHDGWVRRLVPFPCARVRYAEWEQGLVLAPGNPRGVSRVEDLAREGMRFANREPGSGTRLLVERHLRAASVPLEAVPGFSTTRAAGHMAVAEAVGGGFADAGVAILAAARRFELPFIPLTTERYELVVPTRFIELPPVARLLRLLSSQGMRRQVEGLGGYDASKMGSWV